MTKHLTLLLFIGLALGCEDMYSPYACNDMYEPVCGSDGATYDNDCYAENAGITKWTEGECEWKTELQSCTIGVTIGAGLATIQMKMENTSSKWE